MSERCLGTHSPTRPLGRCPRPSPPPQPHSFSPRPVPAEPQGRPTLPVLPRLNIHSHRKEEDLENCVTVPSGDTCPNLSAPEHGVWSEDGCFPWASSPGREEACVPLSLSLWVFFCTTAPVRLIKDAIFSTNLPFLAESTNPSICIFGLGHESKDWLKKSCTC